MDGGTIQRAHVIDESKNYERSIIHFDSEWIMPLLKDLKIDYLLNMFTENRNGLIRIFEKNDVEKIEQSFFMIDQMNDSKHTYKNEAMRKLVLAELLLRIETSTLKVVDKDKVYKEEKSKIAEDVLTFIFRYYRDAISIEDIAKGLDLSKSYISHVFKEITGYSIMNYLMRYRLTASTDALLTEHSKSIKAIAFENGFESDAHFSRFFKKNFGQTPNRYRKSFSC